MRLRRDSVGLRPPDFLGHHVLLPTKTLRSSMQLFGKSFSEDRTFSQVFTTKVMNPLFHVMQLFVIGESSIYRAGPNLMGVVLFSSITLSRRATHIKRAGSEEDLEAVGGGMAQGVWLFCYGQCCLLSSVSGFVVAGDYTRCDALLASTDPFDSKKNSPG